MYNHAPDNYKCPLCFVAEGREEVDFPYTKQVDIFFKTANVTTFIASHWWPNNKGHVIIIPNKHIENIYDLPDDISCEINSLAKKIAIALKETYKCDGVSTRQHNESAGNQDVWHYHLHIFPRYNNDNFYDTHKLKYLSQPKERIKYSNKLKNYFEVNK